MYAFDSAGGVIAEVTVNGVRNQDWEDMASFSHRGINYLLIGAVGDNKVKRDNYSIHLIREPHVKPGDAIVKLSAEVEVTIDFMYEDGSHNCESVAIDPLNRIIYLVTKEGAGSAKPCAIYALPWGEISDGQLIARRVATLDIPTATAMDISSDGSRAIVLTYQDAYEFVRRNNETWPQAFRRSPRQIPMPYREKGEAICYGLDGKTLYLTSECRNGHRIPQPLLMVPAIGQVEYDPTPRASEASDPPLRGIN